MAASTPQPFLALGHRALSVQSASRRTAMVGEGSMKHSNGSIRSILVGTCIFSGLYLPIQHINACQQRPRDPARIVQPTGDPRAEERQQRGQERQGSSQQQREDTAAEELNKLIVMIKCQLAE